MKKDTFEMEPLIQKSFVRKGFDPVWVAFGIICTGVSVILVLNTMVGVTSNSFILYGMIAWTWIRLVELVFRHLVVWTEDIALRFAIAWLTPIVSIIVLGLLNIQIPVFWLSILGCIDLVSRIAVDIRRNWYVLLKNTLVGTLIALLMIKIIIEEHYPWMDALSPAGIGFIDNYRDAATVMAWNNYSTFSHGVHGLMFEAYHSLAAIFISPFLSENFSVFSVFVFFSFVAIPALIFFGVAVVIAHAPIRLVRRNWLFITIVFLFAISQFDLVSTQSSLMMATLLMIGIVPSLAQIWFFREKYNFGNIMVLASILPLIIFARVFNGLILLSIVIPLIYFIHGNISRFILLLSVAISIAFTLLFFGSTVRAESIYFKGLIEYLLRGGYGSWWFLSGWHFIFLPISIFIYEKAFSKTVSHKTIFQDRILGPLAYICVVTLLLLMRTSSSTDAIYQAIPAFFLMFFIVVTAPRRFVMRHFPSSITVNTTWSKGVVYCVALSIFLSVYIENEGQIQHKVDFEEYLLSENLNEIRTNVSETFLLNEQRQCKGMIAHWICDVYPYLFEGYDITKIASNSLPARIARSAIEKAENISGTTGVYISPEHRYWKQEYYRQALPSLYFMSVTGMPMVFGAPDHITNSAYSLLSAHHGNGTLVALSHFSGIDEFCNEVKRVKIQNVVVFENNDEKGYLIKCNK